MEALKYRAEVGADGEATLPRLHLSQGTPVETLVLVREPDAEEDALLQASERSIALVIPLTPVSAGTCSRALPQAYSEYLGKKRLILPESNNIEPLPSFLGINRDRKKP